VFDRTADDVSGHAGLRGLVKDTLCTPLLLGQEKGDRGQVGRTGKLGADCLAVNEVEVEHGHGGKPFWIRVRCRLVGGGAAMQPTPPESVQAQDWFRF
jgi:hypothetical protein